MLLEAGLKCQGIEPGAFYRGPVRTWGHLLSTPRRSLGQSPMWLANLWHLGTHTAQHGGPLTMTKAHHSTSGDGGLKYLGIQHLKYSNTPTNDCQRVNKLLHIAIHNMFLLHNTKTTQKDKLHKLLCTLIHGHVIVVRQALICRPWLLSISTVGSSRHRTGEFRMLQPSGCSRRLQPQ